MFLAILTLLVALGLSGCSAYFSVMGLSAIFSGSYYSILILGSILEIAKLISTSWLYNNWQTANKLLRAYLLTATIILMIITSMGVFGYLSKAHLEQGTNAGQAVDRISYIDQSIESRKIEVEQARTTLKQLDFVIDQALLKGKSEQTAQSANWLRGTQKKERDALAEIIEKRTSEIRKFQEEKAPLIAEIRKLEVEMGPLKYVAELIYGDKSKDNFDKSVRWCILAIVFVFDPLAILLLIAANSNLNKKDSSINAASTIEPEIQTVERIIDRPIEVIKEVEKLIHVPIEVEIFKEVFKDRLVYVNESSINDGKYYYAIGQIGFGTTFPDKKHLSKYFIRIDSNPTQVYEHSDIDWILVDQTVLDRENIDMYILYLIDQIGIGKIKLNDLTEFEVGKVEEKLKQHVSHNIS